MNRAVKLVASVGLVSATVLPSAGMGTPQALAATTSSSNAGCTSGFKLIPGAPADHPNARFAPAINIGGQPWLAGNDLTPTGQPQTVPFDEYWNGTGWSILSTPPGPSAFYGLTGLSANDVWEANPGFGYGDPALAAHWNGKTWTVLDAPPNPDTAAPYGETNDVTLHEVTPNDVWGIGNGPVFVNWNGKTWTWDTEADLRLSSSFQVESIDSNGPDDIWAVGQVGYDYTKKSLRVAAYYFDGKTWHDRSPSLSALSGLYGVKVFSPDNVWAVGVQTLRSDPNGTAVVEHWNGHYWARLPFSPPGLGSGGSALGSISALSSNDIWVAGGGGSLSLVTLVAHWDGSSWTLYPGDPAAAKLTNHVPVDSILATPGRVWIFWTDTHSQAPTLDEQAEYCPT